MFFTFKTARLDHVTQQFPIFSFSLTASLPVVVYIRRSNYMKKQIPGFRSKKCHILKLSFTVKKTRFNYLCENKINFSLMCISVYISCRGTFDRKSRPVCSLYALHPVSCGSPSVLTCSSMLIKWLIISCDGGQKVALTVVMIVALVKLGAMVWSQFNSMLSLSYWCLYSDCSCLK